MSILKRILSIFLLFIFSIGFTYADYENVPGQFGMDNYLQIMKEGIPKRIHEEIYKVDGTQKIKFKDFIPKDFGNSLVASKNLASIDLRYKTMLRVLKEKDGDSGRLEKLGKILNSYWSEMLVLLPLIKSNEGASSDKNPGNNNQGIYQLFSYESARNGGCKGDIGYYTTCETANTLYQAGKSLSEYEQYQQLADFLMFLNNKMKSSDGMILGQGTKSIAQNINFLFQSLGFQTNLDECSRLVEGFNKRDFVLPSNQVVNDFFIKNQLALTQIGINKIDDLAKILTMYYLSARLLTYNGFRYGTNYLDNPYIASLYAPKNGDPQMCFRQCANDGCSEMNTKRGNGAIYFYYNLTEDSVGKRIFINIMKGLRDSSQLENLVPC